MDEVEADLSEFQRRWLRACACYPVLRWPLTIFLGRRLAEADKADAPDMSAHAPLFGLPWFRIGRIPEAQRERLVAAMSEADRVTVRRALEDILQREKAAGAARFAAGAGDDDPVFVQFMLDERPGRAEQTLNEALARFLGSRSGRLLEARVVLRGGAALGLCAVLGLATAWLTRDWTTTTGTVAVPLPELALLPGGTFEMGSPGDEAGRDSDEGPVRPVTIARFALARREVTRGEFARFVAATGHDISDGCYGWDTEGAEWRFDVDLSWRFPGFPQSEDHPVVCVSWEDARAYVDWLNSAVEDASFHLPTEAEWEYATRAGTRSAYFWGSEVDQGCWFANIADATAKAANPDWQTASCDDTWLYATPVGSYRANGFGLYDASGNVWEWVEDCWHEGYAGRRSMALPGWKEIAPGAWCAAAPGSTSRGSRARRVAAGAGPTTGSSSWASGSPGRLPLDSLHLYLRGLGAEPQRFFQFSGREGIVTNNTRLPDNSRRTGPALEGMYRFILWLVPTVEKFPRSQKFLLGDRMQTTALDVLERLVEATYTRARQKALMDANLGIEKLRFLFRLATEMRYLDQGRYEHAARSLDEVGRSIGGWIKAHHAQAT